MPDAQFSFPDTDLAIAQKLGSASGLFNGVGDYVSIPDDPSLDFDHNEDFAIAGWVKIPATQLDTTSTINEILIKWSNLGSYPYALRVYNQTGGGNAGKIQVLRYDGTNDPNIISTNAYNDDQWHQVIFVKNGGTLSLYIDGQFDKSTADTTTTTTTNASPVFFGKRGGATGFFFKGSLDEVGIWDRNLSAPEITTLYAEQNTGTELDLDNVLWDANLISVWHMNSDWLDAKNGNDGTRFGTGEPFVALLTIAAFEEFPLERIPEKYQSMQVMGGGDIKTQDLGKSVIYIRINTTYISASKYAELVSFFQTTVNYMEKTFSYTDQLGTVYDDVRLTEPTWHLPGITPNTDGQYKGSFLMKTDPT